MKQTYLCSNCKKNGLKTSKPMLFETFFCSKCNKNTTLFLTNNSKSTFKQINSLINYSPDSPETPKTPPDSPETPKTPPDSPETPPETLKVDLKLEKTDFKSTFDNPKSTFKSSNGLFSLRDVILILIGFISALLIMKN